MKRSWNVLVALLAITLAPASVLSQRINNNVADEVLRQKAYQTLESLADQLGSLQSGENRARLGSNIAGSLWPHNEAKARQIFSLVTKEIKSGLMDNYKDPDLAQQNFVKLREDTALRIAAHDPQFALTFLQDTTPTDVPIRDEDRNELNLRIAMVIAREHPDLALKLGRESLKDGYLYEKNFSAYMGLLSELKGTSPEQAAAMLAQLVKLAPNQDIRHSMEREQFYIALARLVEPTLRKEPPFRELMNFFTDVALNAGCGKEKHSDNDGFCYRLGLVVPLMEKIDPKRTARLKYLGRRAAFPYEWSPEISEYAEVYERDSIDNLLAMLPKYPEFRGFGQSVVIRKVLEAGDFSRARKLLDEFTWEASDKQAVLKQIAEYERVSNEDTSAELLKEADGWRNEGETFNFLFRKATEIGTRNRQTTLKLLDRASEGFDKSPEGKWKIQYQIGIAVRYCQVKSDRCFTMMEPVVQKMNELVAAATKLESVDNRYLRNGEWNMTAAGGVGSLLTMLAQNAVYFGLYDFDRAITLSNGFERREIRMMAQLKLAQGVLDGPPTKPLYAPQEH